MRVVVLGGLMGGVRMLSVLLGRGGGVGLLKM